MLNPSLLFIQLSTCNEEGIVHHCQARLNANHIGCYVKVLRCSILVGGKQA